MKTMDASMVRKSFARVLETVRDTQENVVVMRYGQPIAALVPIARLSLDERTGLGYPHGERRPGRRGGGRGRR
jgi:antitoxin (DNA-binding transcriptional repressor) of toxin-antitoxin stability system